MKCMPIQTDIARLLSLKAGEHLKTAQKAFEKAQEQKEIEASIQAVILFQTAMEAIINEEVFNHPLLDEVKQEEYELNKRFKSLSFKNKWKRAYDVLQIKDVDYLEEYLNFYTMFRSPISHPRSRYQALDKYTFKNVLSGIESGWYASQLLFAILGKDLTSWDEFCLDHRITP